MLAGDRHGKALPEWVPDAAALYLAHTESGISMRRLAKYCGCHASTVMRQIRKMELRRDDQLVDMALKRLSRQVPPAVWATGFRNLKMQEDSPMTAQLSIPPSAPVTDSFDQEARRILRLLSEKGAVLAVAQDMEKSVVVRDSPSGSPLRSAVVARDIAEAMALKHWIDCDAPGRISRYRITSSGRSALTRLIAEAENQAGPGFEEAQMPFFPAEIAPRNEATARRNRYGQAETPLTLLARRKDRDGLPFLANALVQAGERLREDFELSILGQPGDGLPHFPTAQAYIKAGQKRVAGGAGQARDRVVAALRDLGPGLGDVALRCCCYLEGLESTERRLGWSARSGKIVLRIALQRLQGHYAQHGEEGAMIG